MKLITQSKFIKILFLFNINFFFNGYVFSSVLSSGSIRMEENSIIMISFLLMLIVVVPVIIMSIVFFLRYNSKNIHVKYSPNWTHSNFIETIIWGVPILIVIVLANLSWKKTHQLDPQKKIYNFEKSVNIEVISLDWKWLFIYPKYKIATINEITLPINTPVNFRITSYSVMNSFFIPFLGSQMYAMPGMKTNLCLIANKVGTYKGISSNFSGKGFSGMKFLVHVKETNQSFLNWIHKVKKSSIQIKSISKFKKIAIPKENCKVQYYSYVIPNLFLDVIKYLH